MIHIEDYDDFRAFLIGVLSECGCYLIELGGTGNHVHILFVLNKKISVSEIVGKVKANTSRWFHRRYGTEFSWQEGYGAFSVSQSRVEVVRTYIRNQEEHHRVKGFEEEFREFLKAYDLDWDERYVWD